MSKNTTPQPHNQNQQPGPPTLFVNVGNSYAQIYIATPIHCLKMPISIFEASALFMQLAPRWWELPDPDEVSLVRDIVFTLAGKERKAGLYHIDPLPEQNYRPDRQYIIRLNEVEERKVAQ